MVVRGRAAPGAKIEIVEAGEQLAAAWRQAADDLGIAVEVRGDDVWVADFGSEAGMLVSMTGPVEELASRASKYRCGWSALGDIYMEYSREPFVDALNDWGWYGSGPAPSWYSAEPWTS